MASKRQKPIEIGLRASIVDAALRLAARRDWDNITLSDIAKEAKTSLSALHAMFECREDIICAYGRRIDADVLEAFSGEGSERDQLFDILMERFERLNKDRKALKSVLGSLCKDPKQMVISFAHLAKSMSWMLEAVGITTTGWQGALRIAGLTGIYIWVLRIWRNDDSVDMSKTMAALDKALDRAERCANSLGL
jgi:AcrR family transcriptional regulator